MIIGIAIQSITRIQDQLQRSKSTLLVIELKAKILLLIAKIGSLIKMLRSVASAISYLISQGESTIVDIVARYFAEIAHKLKEIIKFA